MALLVDPDLMADEATDIGTAGIETFINTGTRTIKLLATGDLDATDGVTLQCLYSFLKIQWKDDPNTKNLAAFDFPMVAVTPEQFEFVDDWSIFSDAHRKLVRTGGWSEIDGSSVLQEQHLGVITLGNFEDNTVDTAYFQFGTDQAVDDTVDFDFAGPVNEAIRVYQQLGNPATCDFATSTTVTRASGSFITDGYKVGGQVEVSSATTPANDGTYTLTTVEALTLTISTTFDTVQVDTAAQLAVDNRAAIAVRMRERDADPNGKSYGTVNLADIGITASTTNKVERFPLSSATDLKIAETDANIDANTPYTQIVTKYFDVNYSKDIDTATNRLFGVVIDVGTHSGVDGATTAAGTVLTSADGGIPVTTYDSGVLTINAGTDEGNTHNIASTTATTITITGSTFTSTDTAISYSIQRSAPVVATAEEIYEKVQRDRRQITDINDISAANQAVIGRASDDMLQFVGETLNTLRITNPANADTLMGVVIEGFDSNDTNRLGFTDNSNIIRNFPFVAAGSISFNPNLVNDPGPAKYWMYYTYTTRTNIVDLVLTTSTDILSSAGANLPTTVGAGDYLTISGLTGVDAAMNGVYLVSGTPSASAIDVTRYDGATILTTGSAAADLDQDPIDSPDGIVVDNNAGTDITGTIGASSVGFDFDYDGNVQGGAGNPRTAATDAAVTLIGIGLDSAQHVVSTGTITRAVGLSFSLVSGLERNYNNP